MKAKIIINKNFHIGEIDKRIYGSFIEHVGRAVYSGIYEPSHPGANQDGFRTDVIDLIKQIDVPIIRYPGGNFVSGYNWEDGTGDKSKRPCKQEPAWKSIEPNEVGIDEFQKWASIIGCEINMAVNLGTRGAAEAQNLVEYCNCNTNTHFAELRRKNGYQKPFNIKTWCLGNEMDGPWQIGHKTAAEYGKIACEAAKLMKMTDPDIELVACGSSSYDMKTFGEWELKVLDQAYDYVDYISLHQYYGIQTDNTADLLGRSVHMDSFIKSVAAICDAVKAKKHSQKSVNLSFDEWNVWYRTRYQTNDVWQIAPPILEESYSFEDALLVGLMLMTLQNNCDRVKIACMAQLVNVIAPIMTEKDGKAWAQTIFYPYMYASKYGRGKALKVVSDCESYQTSDDLTVPYLDCSVIQNEEKRELVLFAVNRSLTEEIYLDLELGGFENISITEHIELYSENLEATNTKDTQNIKPTNKATSCADKITLKKHSWNMIRFSY